MLGRLTLGAREVFALDEERLMLSPLLAGGNPVLFPFPSKTKDDTYMLDGREYCMPFHGLVTNAAFKLEQAEETSAVLSIQNSPSWKQSAYPFDFSLKLAYQMTANGVRMETIVTNFSDKPMPHGFGWHCYFTATDKAKFRLTVPMEKYIDYTDGRLKRCKDPDLCVPTDYVFCEKTGESTVIENAADGYRAEITAHAAFNVTTVCTRFDGRVCVEPWIGLPDSANTGQYLEWVPPHNMCAYWTIIKLNDIVNK